MFGETTSEAALSAVPTGRRPRTHQQPPGHPGSTTTSFTSGFT
ncbi:hypothetical protein URH17368_1635 [Alicyclobacillus hesperidum URH17-3-68]|nr:hypothetical protein URH17368_1635 [Alicyclobacillus hesperidum URH17-3-68]